MAEDEPIDLPSKWDLKAMKAAMTAKGRIVPKVQQVVALEAAQDNAHRDTAFLHPSEICKKDWCPRASWYSILDGIRPPQSAAFSRMNVFAEGSTIHKKWQRWLHKAEILEGWWECKKCGEQFWGISPKLCRECMHDKLRYKEVPISDEAHHVIGHADGIINDEEGRAVLEIKTVGTGTVKFDAPELFMPFSKGELTLDQLWSKIRMPFPSHIRQVTLYMHFLDIKEAVVLYEWKPTQAVKEFKLRYNRQHIESILEGCQEVKRALSTGTPVMRPIWATGEDVTQCAGCHYRKRCWSINGSDQASRAVSDGEVHVEVRPSEPTGGVDSPDSGPGRPGRRRFDDDV